MTLTADDREVTQHPKIPELLSPIPVTVQRLDSSDYAFLDRHNEPIGIERCEVGNLIQKIRSGELEEQLDRCQDSFSTVILLTEGVYDQYGGLVSIHKAGGRGYFRTMIYPQTRYDWVQAVKVRLSELGVELIDSPNFQCTMTIIKAIYTQHTKADTERTLFKKTRAVVMPTKLTSDPAVGRLMGLGKRFPEKVAIRLIHKYGSIWGVIHADDSELLQVEGMGRGLLTKLKEGIGKE